MRAPIERVIDVSQAAGLGGPAHTAITIFLPDAGMLADPAVVCFAFPGGGYCRRYYALAMPDDEEPGGQARYHCDRGWIMVACDHLGFGDSTIPTGNALTLDTAAAANDATVRHVMAMLAAGTLAGDLPPIHDATALGIGQSMGGCFTIVAQGQLGTFDGVAILGYSAIHTVVPTRPGTPPFAWPWISRASPLDAPRIMNQAAIEQAASLAPDPAARTSTPPVGHPFQWCFHYDDEPADMVALDMAAAAGTADPLPSWRSATTPPCSIYMVAPGAVALEAACITVPILIAVGERDVVPDPWSEAKAFAQAGDISLFVCPRMGHMHNFAHTRTLFWSRIQAWGDTVARMRRLAR